MIKPSTPAPNRIPVAVAGAVKPTMKTTRQNAVVKRDLATMSSFAMEREIAQLTLLHNHLLYVVKQMIQNVTSPRIAPALIQTARRMPGKPMLLLVRSVAGHNVFQDNVNSAC